MEGLAKDLSEFKGGVAREGSARAGPGDGVAAAARDSTLVFIDSLCKGAAESRPAAPAPANQSTFIYLYGLLQRNSGRGVSKTFALEAHF